MKQQLGRLARNTFIYGVGEILNRLIGFLLLPLFTSYLSPSDYGIASLLGLISFLLTPIFSLGFGAALGVCYFESNNQERKETTVWTSFVLLMISVSTLAVLGTLFAKELSAIAFGTPDHSYLITISILSTCLSILVIPFRLYLQFEERAKTAVALTTAITLISISLSIIMVVILRRGIQGMIESSLIAQVVSAILLISCTAPGIRIRVRWGLSRELLRLGIPLIPAFAFVFIIQQGNKYVLQWFEGLGAVGIYTIGFNFGLFVALIVAGFQTAWMPYFMSFLDKKNEARILFGRILTYYVFGVGSLSLAFFIFAKPVVMIMTQPNFHQAYKVVGLSAGAQFLTGAFSIFLPGIYFAKEVKYVGVVQAVAAALSVVLNLLLIPSLGLLGAGFALMLGMLAMAGLQHAWNLKHRDKYLNVKYEWNRILWFGLLYLACMFLTLFDRSFSLRTEILLSCVGTLVVSIALVTLLSTSERRTVRVVLKELAMRRFKYQSVPISL